MTGNDPGFYPGYSYGAAWRTPIGRTSMPTYLDLTSMRQGARRLLNGLWFFRVINNDLQW
jgi:hypothetical protein